MKIEWNKVTWYSKLGAILLFIFVVPIVTFYIGTQYEKTVSLLGENVIIDQGSSIKKIPAIIKPTPTPIPQSNTGITGSISIGPTCPVQKNPPDPQCADKPYQATLIIKPADGQKEVARVTSNPDGTFRIIVVPGSYLIVPAHGAAMYPQGQSQQVTVSSGVFTHNSISFDSGIR